MSADLTREVAVGRRASMAEEAEKVVKVTLPRPAAVPDWSPITVARLGILKPVEYAFVHWKAAGHSSAESYRRATDLPVEETHHAAVYGHRMLVSEKVAAALACMLKDRNFGARMDREWLLQKIMAQIDECEKSADFRIKRMMPQLLLLVARMTGQIVERHEQEITVRTDTDPAMKRFAAAIQDAERRVVIVQPAAIEE